MESNQVLSPADDDDFYPMNDEEALDFSDHDDTEASQHQENVPAPDISANMDLFRYQQSLFKEVATKDSTPKRYQLDTGSYYDYHFNRFSAKFQELLDSNDLAFNIFFSLQEFIKEFKNCNPDDTESRVAGLTGYLAQIKEDIDKEYVNTKDRNLKAANIRAYNEIAVFLEAAMIWRIENYATQFPDIQEADINQALSQAEKDLKLQYELIIRDTERKNLQDREQEFEKILQKIKDLKICPLWHEKVCKRFDIRQETSRLLSKLKRGELQEGFVDDQKTPGAEETRTGERYKGEVPNKVFEEIRKKKEKISEEKDKLIIDKKVYKVSDSFDIPSGYILEGTYFDQKLKTRAAELESLNLKHGNLEVFKALNGVIEVINLLFNTPVEQMFFSYHISDLISLIKGYQKELEKIGDRNNEIYVEMVVFMMRFVDIVEDILEWKKTSNTSHGDVKNKEVERLLKEIEASLEKHEEFFISMNKLTTYMTTKEYDERIKVIKEELEELLTVRLSAKNTDCVEKIDSLMTRLEVVDEGLRQVYGNVNRNYRALKALYEDHKSNITKGVYTIESRARYMKNYEGMIEDFDTRFGESIAYGIRKKYGLWPRELVLMKLGGK